MSIRHDFAVVTGFFKYVVYVVKYTNEKSLRDLGAHNS